MFFLDFVDRDDVIGTDNVDDVHVNVGFHGEEVLNDEIDYFSDEGFNEDFSGSYGYANYSIILSRSRNTRETLKSGIFNLNHFLFFCS